MSMHSLSVVHPNAKIAPDVTVGPFTTIEDDVEIGEGSSIASNVTIYAGSRIGKNVEVFPGAVIGGKPQDLKFDIILANNVNLAGHVELEDFVIIEGQVGVQQFVRIGKHSFVAGGSLVRKSVPPYIRAAREPLSYIGVNRIGLQRRGFAIERINNIHEIYRILFVKGLNLTNAITEIETTVPVCDERDDVVKFIAETERTGIIRSFQGLND